MVKKASQERLASRISTLLDITLNDDDGLLNLVKFKKVVSSCAASFLTSRRDGKQIENAILNTEESDNS